MQFFQGKALTKWLVVMTVCVILVAAYGAALVRPVSVQTSQPMIVTIKSGMTASDIGELLFQRGLIRSIFLFRVAARLEGVENGLQAGDYAFNPGMTVQEICRMLAKGETYYREFTIPEGYTVDQIAALLAGQKLVNPVKFKELAVSYAPYSYMAPGPNTKYAAEGFLFPDTYRVSGTVTEAEILKMMVDHFDEQLTSNMRDQIQAAGMTVREAVTMASLVEKEAQLPQDRPVISGVFRNRLKQEMPLQSCATIQYILGYPKPELSIQDTEIISPYNTYQNRGLPPGPISNPGLASLRAALEPAATDYLYFVADNAGAHHFSRTYDEHLAAIAQVRN